VNLHDALLWGFVATALLTTTMMASQGFGITRMSIPFLLGTVLTPARDRAVVAGAAVHFVNGWLFAFVYALGFESLGRATWWIGLLAVAQPGAFVLDLLMPLMPGLHPRRVS
jgi:hypothetical protein